MTKFSIDRSKNWQTEVDYFFNVSNKHPLFYLSSSSDLLNLDYFWWCSANLLVWNVSWRFLLTLNSGNLQESGWRRLLGQRCKGESLYCSNVHRMLVAQGHNLENYVMFIWLYWCFRKIRIEGNRKEKKLKNPLKKLWGSWGSPSRWQRSGIPECREITFYSRCLMCWETSTLM